MACGVAAGGHPVREAPQPEISQTRQGMSATHRTRDRGLRLMGRKRSVSAASLTSQRAEFREHLGSEHRDGRLLIE